MSGVEVLASLGLVATEVFRYNRENYEFDQDQRFEREELRIKMQVERFALFREDIRDLVELTVSKMDLYHLVGALFLKMIVIYYAEGFFIDAAPVFLIAFYYVSAACAALYLLMAIWLAMHASISSHSYATRLLTRFVRLPIPGSKQLNVLNARYADFEKQGVQMLRVPFVRETTNDWQQRAQMQATSSSAADPQQGAPDGSKVVADFLDNGEFGYGGARDLLGYEQELMNAVEFRTQRHVQLFRNLQARWQCYDAYARVCMSLGVRQMLQAISYYLIGICTVQTQATSLAFLLVVVFQALALNIAILDIHAMNDHAVVGALPSLLACLSLSFEAHRGVEGELEADNVYWISLAMYPLEVLWFELLHWVASPRGDRASLPRQFRSVLFMDVFADLVEPPRPLSAARQRKLEEAAAAAAAAVARVRAAVRRWEAVPSSCMTFRQRRQRNELCRSYDDAVEDLAQELQRRGMAAPREDGRQWKALSARERLLDPFPGTVLGPFGTWPLDEYYYYYDIEKSDEGPSYLHGFPETDKILTLQDALDCCEALRKHVTSFQKAAAPAHDAGREGIESNSDGPTGRETNNEQSPAASTKRRGSRDDAQEEPARLPWFLVSFLTRAIQLVWIGLGVVAALRETRTNVFDYQASHILEERRLSAVEDVQWAEVAVAWPYGQFFRPETLTCIPAVNSASLPVNGTVIIGTQFAQYTLGWPGTVRDHQAGIRAGQGSVGIRLDEIPTPTLPAGARLFCGVPGAPCLLGERTQGGLLLQSLHQAGHEAVKLRLRHFGDGSARSWQLLSGGIVDCSVIGGGQAERSYATVPWCLLVAGWSGKGSEITVSLAELPGLSANSSLEEILAPVSIHLNSDASTTSHSQAEPSVVALHVDAQQGWLWALFSTGRLEAWTLLAERAQQVGSWLVRWPGSQETAPPAFAPQALCRQQASAASPGSFLVLGKSSTSGLPSLLHLAVEL